MNPATVACTLQLLMVTHHMLTEWLDLFPYNNVRRATLKERVASTLVIAGPAAVSLLAFGTSIRWLMGIAVVYWCLLFVAECCNWWIPYFFARYPWEVNPETYRTWGFTETFKILGPFRGHPVVPDAQHLAVMLLTGASLGTAVYALVRP